MSPDPAPGAGAGAPWTPGTAPDSSAIAPQAAGRGRPKRIRLAIVCAVGGGLGYALSQLMFAGISAVAYSATFGDTWEKLPAATRTAYEARIKAAVGDEILSKRKSEVQFELESLIVAGLPRLEDAILVRRVELYGTMYDRVDVPTCAKQARVEMTATDTYSFDKDMLATLTTDEYATLIETNVQALEAGARSAPDPRVPTKAEQQLAYANLFVLLGDSTATSIGKLTQGTALSDAETCTSTRSLYANLHNLSIADETVIARAVVAP